MSEAVPIDPRRKRRSGRTATYRFGSSRRESHDSSPFYSRFQAPDVTGDDSVERPSIVDRIFCRDARDMSPVASNSVALVVTSPPYFAGKEYEDSLCREAVPTTYLEYLQLLEDVFSECKRVLEPGGRIAVNVANLGRRPYRSLSSDVICVLERLGYLPRGEVIWWKGRSASGSCAWGTFAHPANPVLRDVTERVVIASKGRFDRALRPAERARRGLPAAATISKDEFLEATLDLWEIAPESATRVGHPAPFPVELPMRLIELYTYKGDLVLDPFVGSGSTAVAAIRTGRRYLGFDTDEGYVRLAQERVAAETSSLGEREMGAGLGYLGRRGMAAIEVALELVSEAGFIDIRPKQKLPPASLEVSLLACDSLGRQWAFDVAGSFGTASGGLKKREALFEVVAKGSLLQASSRDDLTYAVVATELPPPKSHLRRALDAAVGPGRPIRDVILLEDGADLQRLAAYARGRM